MERKKTVLVVVAHGDDMEFMAGGTVARFVSEKGYRVFEYILTDNSKGSFHRTADDLSKRARHEAEEAGRVLGLEEVRLEEYPDGQLNEIHSNVLREKIMAFLREVKADIVMSWDPFAPCEDHPDHRMVAMATLEAASFSHMPLFHPEHKHPPYLVTEAYWFAKSPWNADKFVDISTTVDKKIDALMKHEAQMELTVEALRREAQHLGADLPLLQGVDLAGQRQVIEMGIRSFCAATGAPARFEYAELFRYEKMGMIDKLFGGDFVRCDF